MSDELKNGQGEDKLQPSDETSGRRRRRLSRRGTILAWWLIAVALLIAIPAAGFYGYLSLVGIDPAWALGTSGWAAPPGATLAGRTIGGRPVGQLTDTVNQINKEFSGLSIWLVESPLAVSVVDGEFTVSTASEEVALSVAPEELGIRLDVQGILKDLARLEMRASDAFAVGERIELWKSPPELPARISTDLEAARSWIEAIRSTVECEPVDAALDLANRTIFPGRDGIKIDVGATLRSLPAELDSMDDLLVTLAVNRTRPKVTNDAFESIDLENPLSSYTTRFNCWKRNRSRNIEMVAARFEGAVIKPGQVFSFNECTGPRRLSEGYLLAPMYRDRRIELSPAGGSCQVSTTLYNAVLLAGLEIVERYPHSRPCSYVPYGRDATVAENPPVDFKFRNSLNHPIILHQSVDVHQAGTITFEIFGHPDDRVHVEIGNAYSWIARTESMTAYIVDRSLAPGEEVVEDAGVNGIVQRAWRTWFDEDGNELYTEQSSYDRLRPVGALIRHNPDGIEKPPPSTEEAPLPAEPPEDELPPGAF